MVGWIFAGITLTAVLLATFVGQMRNAILALWVAGLGVGAIFLTEGAEFLAIIQWIVSTLVTISFIFFSVMFGEFNAPRVRKSNSNNNIVLTVLSLILGIVFAAVIWLGSRELPPSAMPAGPGADDLAVVGRLLTQDHLLSLEVLVLTLFLVLVGGGVIARSEGSEGSRGSDKGELK